MKSGNTREISTNCDIKSVTTISHSDLFTTPNQSFSISRDDTKEKCERKSSSCVDCCPRLKEAPPNPSSATSLVSVITDCEEYYATQPNRAVQSSLTFHINLRNDSDVTVDMPAPSHHVNSAFSSDASNDITNHSPSTYLFSSNPISDLDSYDPMAGLMGDIIYFD